MINTFEDFKLDLEIEKSLDFLEYKVPFEVQKKVIPLLMENKNVLVKAKTGSGKSASFGIPICNSIERADNKLRALIIVPTRELAIQVKEEIENIGRRKLVKCSAVFGKEVLKNQALELKQGVNVVVATPGRIIDHISRNNIDLSNLRYFIIDEVDKMLTKGFREDIDYIISRVNPDSCRAFFSATVDSDFKAMVDNYLENYEFVDIKEEVSLDNKIVQGYIEAVGDKEKALEHLLDELKPSNAIVFANTKKTVERLYQAMKEKFSVEAIHGDISQQRRFYIVEEFKEAKFNVLISSDIIARGIHIDDVDLVVNYDVPEDREVYVHRVGRTARAGKNGLAITLVSSSDIDKLEAIELYINKKIQKLSIENLKLLEKVEKPQATDKAEPKSDIVKIFIGIGKKKKIRIGDIVGSLNNIDILENTDIGVIKVYDTYTEVDILNQKGNLLLEKYKEITVKNKKAKIKRVI